MPNTIRIKRRPSSGDGGKPSSLYNGELAFNESDNILYYGYGSGVSGVATSIEQIGGTGYFATRGGTNASGLWPISVNGNSATVTNGVYTTGNQTINGLKTFGDTATFNSGISAVAINTSSNSVGYFAVFDNNPDSSTQTLKSVSKDQILDDIGAATSGLIITAGSGLVGGGSLSQNRSFDIGQGDGISVSADSIAVDSTVVRTTGDQNIGGIKTFTGSNVTILPSVSATPSILRLQSSQGSLIYLDNSSGTYLSGYSNNLFITNENLNKKIELSSDTIDLLSTNIRVKAPSTSGNTVNYFAVFDSNPNSSLTTLKSVSKDQILDDIGAATSGLDITAGSGLVGGGTLSQNRRFDVGAGDGISVNADSIAVDSTVVRTTGNQNVSGVKTFNNISINGNYLGGASNIPLYLNTLNNNAASSSMLIQENYDTTILDIRNNGNIAIGNITGAGFTHRLNIRGSTNDSTRAALSVSNSGASTLLHVRNDGNIGIGTTNPSGQLHVVGTGIFSSQLQILSQTSDTIASFDNNRNIVSLNTSTYPSLTELSYAKGVTSAIQTQLDNRIIRPSSTTSGNIPIWTTSNGTNLGAGYSVEDTLTGGSGALPRADAVKTYVDNMITSGIATNDAMLFKGAIDCSGNPNYPAADRGWTYKVSVAGKIGGASGPAVEVNDTLICTTDGTSAGNHATVGSNWVILQTNIVDASILVTGPNSSTSGNVSMFDGSTGKIIKDGGFLVSDIARQNITNNFAPSQTFNQGFTVLTEESGAGIFKFASDSDAIVIQPQDVGNSNRTITLVNPTTALTVNRTIAFPDKDGTIALFSDITTTNISGVLSVDKGGTGQSSYTNGQLLIGNTSGNTLTKATLTQGTSIDITNGNGSITIGHADTSTLTGAQGSNGIASFTLDGLGHVTAVTTATYLTAGTVCAAIADCPLDGGSF